MPHVEPIDLKRLSSFDDACAAVIAYLDRALPMHEWFISRFDGDNQVSLSRSRDVATEQSATSARPWEETLCSLMLAGDIPSIVPDTRIQPAIAESGNAEWIDARTYIGIPFTRADGTVFGTVCGYDLVPRDGNLDEHVPLFELLAALLSNVLDADHARADAERRAHRALIDAETDPLTGLLNRRGWDERLGPEDERWSRFGDPTAIVVADLDRMKQINDQFGHAAGDELIRRAATVLRQWAAPTDVLARLGGDEFGALLIGSPAARTSNHVDDLAAAFAAADVDMSIGVASFADAGGSRGAWKAADASMYAAKKVDSAGRRARA